MFGILMLRFMKGDYIMKNALKENLKKAYDKTAHVREKNEVQQWKIKPREEFLKYIKDENKRYLLDIGAGTGKYSKFFKDNNLEVKAVDISSKMVKHCIEKGIEAYEMDFFQLHLLESKFDAVWAMNTLLHVEKQHLPEVLQGINNVLNESGLFFMGVYGGVDQEGIWEEDTYQPPRFFSFYEDESIKKILSKYFEIVSFEVIETGGNYDFQSIIMRKL